MLWAVLFVACLFAHGYLHEKGFYPATPVLWLAGTGVVVVVSGPVVALWLFYIMFWFWLIGVRTSNEAPLEVSPYYTNTIRNVIGLFGLFVGIAYLR